MSSTQPELQRIESALRGWDARLRLQQSGRWLPWGLAGGLLAAALLAAAARIWPLFARERLIAASAVLAAAGIAAALIAVWLWRRSPIDLARRFDRLFGLKERLSTALELAAGDLPDQSPALTTLQRIDAAGVIDGVQPARYLPLRTDWRAWAAVGVAAGALAAAVLIPNPQQEIVAQQQAVQQAVAEQIAALEDLREQVLEDDSLTDAERAAIIETLDEAIDTLDQRGISEEEALAALNAAEQELRDLSEQFAVERQQALQEASGLFEGEALQEAAEALEAGDLVAAGEALQNLDLSQLTPEQLEALAEQLQQAAGELAETNPDLAEALEQAAEAAQSGDASAAEEALEQAGEAMAEAGDGTTAEVEGYADQLDESQQGFAGAVQPGEGGMGQAQPGQQGGQGEGGQPGEGPEVGQIAGETPRGGGAPDGGETPYDDIYAPQRIGGEGGEDVDLPGDQPGDATGVEGNLAENPTGEAGVPYTSVWGDYSRSVNEALETGYIPLGMRALIQQYFSRLDPGQ